VIGELLSRGVKGVGGRGTNFAAAADHTQEGKEEDEGTKGNECKRGTLQGGEGG